VLEDVGDRPAAAGRQARPVLLAKAAEIREERMVGIALVRLLGEPDQGIKCGATRAAASRFGR
jgi:hypothetical protein